MRYDASCPFYDLIRKPFHRHSLRAEGVSEDTRIGSIFRRFLCLQAAVFAFLSFRLGLFVDAMASHAQQGAAHAALSSSESIRSLQRETPKQPLLHQNQHKRRVSLPCSTFHGHALSVKPLVSQGQCRLSRDLSWTSPTNEVAVDGSSNSASAVSETNATLDVTETEDVTNSPPVTAKEASISAAMTDVANLIKLVDSRDIVELELKHLDFELVIRKKEALQPPAAPMFTTPQVIAQAPYPAYASPPPPMAVPVPAAAPAQDSPPQVPAVPSGSDLLHILSPMSGTLYKCPAPGEPPFVKVGDKVQKGQVICIVEAMKLMNDIEADQSGTVVEILAEDGKPVSVDMPLFAIKP